nr:hypothetical protein BDOA9_0105620 [Bradyrhizobium sp. DOA9]
MRFRRRPDPAAGTNRARVHSACGFDASPGCARLHRFGVRDVASGDGGNVGTVIENLLLRKQKLVEQLEQAPSVEDRDRIEHQLEQINTALDFLDRPASKEER